MSDITVSEDDDEFGEHRGCDGREYLHDDAMAGTYPAETDWPVSDLQRLEGFKF